MRIIKHYKEISLFRKHFDIITNNIHYPIANFLCAVISTSFITPNMVTSFAVLSELGAIWLIFVNLEENKIIIVLLLQLGLILDLMDGLLARYKNIGFYHPTNPSLKGYYWDAVSDHILRLIVLTSLGIHLAQQEQYGFYYAFGGILIHAITQVEHIIRDYILIKDETQDNLRVFLNYDQTDNPVIHGIQRISKPGCRNYVSSDKLPRVLNGMGIAILSTSKGVMSNKKAKSLKVGGEVLCHVW